MQVQDRCPQCPVPAGYVQKPTPDHRYGDYLVLKPDESSAQTLLNLANLAKEVIAGQTGVPSDRLTAFDPSRFHLTVATPLKPLKREEVNTLMKVGKELVSSPVTFKAGFDSNVNRDRFAITTSSPNFANGFDIRLKPGTVTQQASYQTLVNLGENAREHCKNHQLVNLNQNSNGECNPFNPHITLGKISETSDCRLIHNRAQHKMRSEQLLSELIKQKFHELLSCQNQGNILTLRFDRLEILRLDAKDGDSQTSLISSLNLVNHALFVSKSLPGCSHKQEAPAALAAFSDHTTSNPAEKAFVFALSLLPKYEEGYGYYELRDDIVPGQYIIRDKDTCHGETDFYNGEYLNRKFEKERGSLDFCIAFRK